jgi:hypothetical protein
MFLRGKPHASVAEQTLALVDDLETVIERAEVPALAGLAHHPQSSLPRVERDAASYGKLLDDFICAERLLAEQTSGVQSG